MTISVTPQHIPRLYAYWAKKKVVKKKLTANFMSVYYWTIPSSVSDRTNQAGEQIVHQRLNIPEENLVYPRTTVRLSSWHLPGFTQRGFRWTHHLCSSSEWQHRPVCDDTRLRRWRRAGTFSNGLPQKNGLFDTTVQEGSCSRMPRVGETVRNF